MGRLVVSIDAFAPLIRIRLIREVSLKLVPDGLDIFDYLRLQKETRGEGEKGRCYLWRSMGTEGETACPTVQPRKPRADSACHYPASTDSYRGDAIPSLHQSTIWTSVAHLEVVCIQRWSYFNLRECSASVCNSASDNNRYDIKVAFVPSSLCRT